MQGLAYGFFAVCLAHMFVWWKVFAYDIIVDGEVQNMFQIVGVPMYYPNNGHPASDGSVGGGGGGGGGGPMRM